MIEIVIDGFAQAMKAPQGVIVPPLPPPLRNRHSVRMYTPAEVKSWQTTARILAAEKMKGNDPLDGALTVMIFVYIVPPSSLSMKKRMLALEGKLRPITRPDVDNYAKAIADALTGIVWIDDAQIVELHVGKFYASKPRVVVTVEPFAPTERPFEFRKQPGLFDQ